MVLKLKLNTRVKYYSALCGLCLLVFCGVFVAHIIRGYSFICNADAMNQYFNFFVFEGEWLRGVFLGLIETGELNPEFYSFSAGLGADVLMTTAGCFNDPFNLVSAVVPVDYAEAVFEGLIFVRLFCAAAAFSVYCFARGHSTTAAMCGAVCYVGTGYVVFWGALAHPNFINVSIVLPLVLYGVDRIFDRKSPVPFCVSLALSLLFSVYFSFMVCLVVLAYCLIKYVYRREQKSVIDFASLFARFVAAMLISFLIASVVVIPEVITLTSMGRVGLERYVPLLFDFSHYWSLVSTIFGASDIQCSLYVGVVPILCVAVLVVCKHRFPPDLRRAWLVGVLLCIIGSLVPIVGHVMNGFGYVTDRWMFAYGFCAAYLVVMVVPVLPSIAAAEWKKIVLLLVPLLLLALLYAIDMKTSSTMLAAAFPVLGILCLVLVCRFKSIWVTAVVVALAVLNVGAASCMCNSPWGEGHVSRYVKAGSALAQVEEMNFLEEPGGGSEYRVDRAGIYGVRNAALVNGYKGMDFYSSFYNQSVDDLNAELGMSGDYLNYRFNGFDSRFAIEALLGAKRYVASHGHEKVVPYSYLLKNEDGSYGVYETPYALPIGFVYENTISRCEYDEANMIEKQELLSEGCVVDGSDSADGISDLATTSTPVEIVEQSGLEVRDNLVVVSKPNATLVVKSSSAVDGEVYFCFEGLRYEPADADVLGSKTLSAFLKAVKTEKASSARIKVSNGIQEKSFGVVNKYGPSYGGKDDFAVNLGVTSEDDCSYVLQFGQVGEYSFEDMYIACQSVDSIASNLISLQENAGLDLEFGNDEVEAIVPAAESADRYVFFSLPFSTGWKAYVDGEETVIERANTAFMAVKVDEFEHHIRLEYNTPGLALGTICTCVGLALVLLIWLWHRRSEAHRDNPK